MNGDTFSNIPSFFTPHANPTSPGNSPSSSSSSLSGSASAASTPTQFDGFTSSLTPGSPSMPNSNAPFGDSDPNGVDSSTSSNNPNGEKSFNGLGNGADGLADGALVGTSGGSGTTPSVTDASMNVSSQTPSSSSSSSSSSAFVVGASVAGIALAVMAVTLLVAGIARKRSRSRRDSRLAARHRFSLPPTISHSAMPSIKHSHRKSLMDVDLNDRSIGDEEASAGSPSTMPLLKRASASINFLTSWWPLQSNSSPSLLPARTSSASMAAVMRPSFRPISSFRDISYPPVIHVRGSGLFGNIDQGGVRDSVGSVIDAQMTYTVHRLSEAEHKRTSLRVVNRMSADSAFSEPV